MDYIFSKYNFLHATDCSEELLIEVWKDIQWLNEIADKGEIREDKHSFAVKWLRGKSNWIQRMLAKAKKVPDQDAEIGTVNKKFARIFQQ